ncbi:ABC transporter permease [uncultured Eubacterium sp.]|uniref:ABC transporter permease n=1 Tax=uncultured Eubacterium sp. TaxID=165185 RepID=UPI0025D0F25B|nr:ABC transporter permease [uncultured Eubacterium sp.]
MVKTMSTLASIFDAGQMQTVLELGLISSLTVLALFLSYTMLNVCDLSTDGCFTLGAAVGAIVALNGHPILSIPLAMLAGVASGLITALLQTVLGIDSLLAGIVVNTGLYSINIAVMKKSSLLNLNSAETVFSLLKAKLDGTALEGKQTLIIAALAVFLIVLFLSLFLKTKLGLSIRATGNNPDMVKSSSINPIVTTIIGLCIANSFTALSGCLLAQSQKQAEINIGTGMVTVALASLLIGGVFVRRGKIPLRAIGAVIGAVVFRLVYQIAIGLHMPPFMLKFVSSVIVIIAIAGPYLKTKMPEYIRKAKLRSGKKVQ